MIGIALVALERGPLIRENRGWRFGRRRFSWHTVNALVARGHAIKDGDKVWRSPSTTSAT
jgi:hypothetical protein